MRSTDGRHYAGLDHLRGLAAFLIVFWHFSHGGTGTPMPFAQSPELALLDEGHVGVALFMTLSGYLFAKLIGDRAIDYRAFFWNRFLRLALMLAVTFLLVGLLAPNLSMEEHLRSLATGLILPVWPQGSWSVAVEMHFYLLLPVLLLGARRWPALPLAVAAFGLTLRLLLWQIGADVQHLANYTLIGRIDQFALGMFIATRPVSGRTTIMLCSLLWLAYAGFDLAGGLHDYSRPWIWIALPTIEAAGCAALISWYDRHPFTGRWTRIPELAGTYSYSIYLLHCYPAEAWGQFFERHVGDFTNIYQLLPFSLIFFAYMMGIGWFTYRFIEQPFLRFRRPYLLDGSHRASQPAKAKTATI